MPSISPTTQSVEWLSQGIRTAFRMDDNSGISNDDGIDSSTSIPALFQLVKKDLMKTSSSNLNTNEGDNTVENNVNIGDVTSSNNVADNDDTRTSATVLGKSLSQIKLLLFDEKKKRDDALNMTYHANSYDDNNSNNLKTVAGDTLRCLTEIFDTGVISKTDTQVDNVLGGKDKYFLLQLLLVHLAKLPFEARKNVSSIFNYLLCCDIIGNCNNKNNEEESEMGAHRQQKKDIPIMVQFSMFIQEHYLDIMTPLVEGHMNINLDVALHCGSMFRATMQHANLYKLLLTQKNACKLVYPFLDTLVHVANFEITSDALETLRWILTGGGGNNNSNNDSSKNNSNGQQMEAMAAHFLEQDYDAIFVERFNPKLLHTGTATMKSTDTSGASSKANTHNNYITRRVSLQLLTTVLLTRANYNVMIKYISSKSNLRTNMILLRDASPHITLDAFHVFKIFVANPSKPSEIIKVLVDNKVKLIAYLETLHRGREQSDEQFRDEKALVIATLQGLEY